LARFDVLLLRRPSNSLRSQRRAIRSAGKRSGVRRLYFLLMVIRQNSYRAFMWQ
jgi:hypothetical protein